MSRIITALILTCITCFGQYQWISNTPLLPNDNFPNWASVEIEYGGVLWADIPYTVDIEVIMDGAIVHKFSEQIPSGWGSWNSTHVWVPGAITTSEGYIIRMSSINGVSYDFGYCRL